MYHMHDRAVVQIELLVYHMHDRTVVLDRVVSHACDAHHTIGDAAGVNCPGQSLEVLLPLILFVMAPTHGTNAS